MGTKATRKDFYMEIKKSLGRFLSILFIVALGVAFFSGIRSAEPAMRITGDSYFDDSELMDIKAVATLGITERDIKALKRVDGVAKVEGGYSADFLCDGEDRQIGVHVMSLLPTMNQVAVTKGRLPEKAGECLADDEMHYKVGDKIVLEPGGDAPVTDTLNTEMLTVVGTGNSPCYIAFQRGNTTIGTGSLSGFLYVTEQTFDLEVYTEAYIQVGGAEKLTAFTDPYQDKIDKVIGNIEAITDKRGKIRREELVDDASKELSEAEKELEDGRAEADRELREAGKKLSDGEQQIADARAQVEEGKRQLAAAKVTLTEKQKELDDAQAQYHSGVQQLEDGKAAYMQGMAELGRQKQIYDNSVAEAGSQFAEKKQGLDQLEQICSRLTEGIAQCDMGISSMEAQIAWIPGQIQQNHDKKTELEHQIHGLAQQADELTRQVDELTQKLNDLQAEQTLDPEEKEKQVRELQSQIADAKSMEADAKVRLADAKAQLSDADNQINILQEQQKILPEQLEALKVEREGLEKQLYGNESNPGPKPLYDQAKQAYDAARVQADAQLASAKQKLDEGAAVLASSKAQLDTSGVRLNEALLQIQSGQSHIDAGFKEISSREESLASGAAELADREAELADGRKEYEEARGEAEQKLSDGEQKIIDARREIRKIKNPKWYVYDRSTLSEYSGYGDNADRMRAIGKVFPVLFFLVAALISLTSMTRMVEEQRTEIGTMKALGYDKKTIASKYLGYALLATMGGSILGVLFGEKVLPYIIIYAYEIMYHHLPEILTPYNLTYAVAATLAAVVCTMGATMAACFKELAAQPAVLMRPPAPKNGTRVLLERVTFIWKHLSFTWKSTVRNLMRYKKRFFMTVFGIGGCMALMLVGFGLKDSILDIANIQYDQLQEYDGTAYLLEDITDKERKDVKEFLEKDRDIEQYMNADMKNITLVNGKEERDSYQCVPESIVEIEKFIHFRNRRTHEKYSLTDKGAIISEKTAKLLDAKTGDTIYIKDEEKGNKAVKIADICENYMGHYIYLAPELYKEIYGAMPEYNCVFFKTADASGKSLDETGQRILEEPGVLSISYLKDIQKQLNDMLKSLNLVIVVLIISAGMLAFVVLYNLNNINITERQRELATIKVLGFFDPEVAAYVYRENILLTLIGSCAGMVMGRVLHLFVVQTVEVDEAMFGRNINFPSYIYSLLFTIAFSLFVNLVMYFKLKKIDMVESLKSIE